MKKKLKLKAFLCPKDIKNGCKIQACEKLISSCEMKKKLKFKYLNNRYLQIRNPKNLVKKSAQ